MTQDALAILQTVFTSIWRLFNGWYIPGTNTTPGMWAFFILSAFLSIRLFKHFLSGSSSDDKGGKG